MTFVPNDHCEQEGNGMPKYHTGWSGHSTPMRFRVNALIGRA